MIFMVFISGDRDNSGTILHSMQGDLRLLKQQDTHPLLEKVVHNYSVRTTSRRDIPSGIEIFLVICFLASVTIGSSQKKFWFWFK